ncbi:MAG: histidine kinase [Dehalococcoidales bacterium]|nr:histidine kinase [Dehalococcoidales bacterium]
MSRKKLVLLSIVTEMVGIIGISTGVGVELATHADYGYGIITVGSLFVAAGGLLFAKIIPKRKED